MYFPQFTFNPDTIKPINNAIDNSSFFIKKYTLPDSKYATSIPTLKDLSKGKFYCLINL